MSKILSFFTIGMAFTALLCLYARPLGERLGVMDKPSNGSHKIHTEPTPAVGGVICAVVAVLMFLVSFPWLNYPFPEERFARSMVLLTVLLTMIVGLIDDRRHLPAITRLAFGTVIPTVTLLIIPELQVDRVKFASIDLTVYTGFLALPFTVLCLLALKNAVNMADGRNGLLLGMAFIWTVYFLFHAREQMIPTLSGVLGSLIVLFAFNWRGKLFMGDCGSYGLATFFGFMALGLHNDAYGTAKTAEVVLLFLIPVLDTGRLLVVRVISGRSPLAPDNQHLHHLLENALGWTRGWFVYMALIALPLLAYQFFEGRGVHLIVTATMLYALTVWECSSIAKIRGRAKRSDEGSMA